MKLCSTKFEVSSFISFRDIVEGMPNILGVTWPRPRSLSQILYLIFVGGAKMKLDTKFEVSSFISFRDIVKAMPNFPRVT